MPKTLLVTGANGHYGRLVLDALLDLNTGDKIVAATRDPAKLDDFAARGVEVRAADFEVPATLDKAFAGADRVLIVSTDTMGVPGKRIEQHSNAVEAAKRAGVERVYYTSMPSPDDTAITFAPDHLKTEEAIKASGLAYTLLRNGWYMENLFMSLPGALASGKWFTSSGQGRTAHAARADQARAAAAALANPPAENAIYTLTGPAAFTTEEVAAMVSEATVKPLEVVHVTDDQLAEGMKAHGLPDFLIPTFVSFDTNTREGKIAMVTDDIEKLTGKKPTTLEAFLKANAATLAG